MVEDWMLKKDEYTPVYDKAKFIDKCIMSIASALSKVRRKQKDNSGIIYAINPVAKAAVTFVSLLLIALSKSHVYIIVMAIYSLAGILLLKRSDRINIVGVSLVIPSFTFIMLLPSMISGNTVNSYFLILKIAVDILLVNTLSYTTPWNEISKALKLFLIPDIFIWIMEITLKYIVLLGEYSMNMLYALKLRSIGRNNKKQDSLSRIMGNLFIKSKHMGDEMFAAMECRGFIGEYQIPAKYSMKKIDIYYILVNIALAVVFVITVY